MEIGRVNLLNDGLTTKYISDFKILQVKYLLPEIQFL